MAINVNIPSQFREYANLAAFPATGSAKILYVAKNTNKLYRWDTSAYVEVSASAASSWGSITGTLSNQTDLQSALDSKVSDVTASSPLASSGGTTPDISIPQANVSTDGYLSSTDWTTFNGKQANLISGVNIKTVNSQSILGIGQVTVQDTLVSGTNIKTVNSTSILGSGDVAVQPTLVSGTNIKTINGSSVLGSGDLVVSGGGASGLRAPFVVSGGSYSYGVNANLLNSGTSISNNQMRLVPFKPSETFTCSALYINCTLLFAGNLARILIYSDLNNKPNTKLYESADLDLSTIGIKTATTSFTFNAGTTYWICTHTSGSTANLTILPNTAVYPIRIGGTSSPSTCTTTQTGYTIGSAPTTIGAINYISGSVFYVGITAV